MYECIVDCIFLVLGIFVSAASLFLVSALPTNYVATITFSCVFSATIGVVSAGVALSVINLYEVALR